MVFHSTRRGPQLWKKKGCREKGTDGGGRVFRPAAFCGNPTHYTTVVQNRAHLPATAPSANAGDRPTQDGQGIRLSHCRTSQKPLHHFNDQRRGGSSVGRGERRKMGSQTRPFFLKKAQTVSYQLIRTHHTVTDNRPPVRRSAFDGARVERFFCAGAP